MPELYWPSKTRNHLTNEVHEQVFAWAPRLIADKGLVKSERIGVDALTRESKSALYNIVCRVDSQGYNETPNVDDLEDAR